MRDAYKSKKNALFLNSLIVIFSVFFGDWGKMYYYDTIKSFPNPQAFINLNVIISSGAYLILSFLSDIWCRKKMLYFSVLLLLFSGLFLKVGFPMLSTIFIAIAPVTPIAIAAYCDVHVANDREPNVINAFMIRPLPWMLFPFVYKSINGFFMLSMLLGALVSVMLICWFADNRDKDARKFNLGILEAIRVYGMRVVVSLSCAFYLSNWAWSLLFYYLEGVENESIVASNFMLSPGICFFLGAVFARTVIRKKSIFTVPFKGKPIRKSNHLRLIIYLSMGAIPFIIFISYLVSLLNGDRSNVVLNSLPLFTFFGGVFIPAIYAFFGSRLEYHSLGFVYAWLEVVQSLSEYTGAKIETFTFFKGDLNHIIIFSIALSFIALIVLLSLPKKEEALSTSSQNNN